MATVGTSITLNGYDYEEPEDYNRSVENVVPENLGSPKSKDYFGRTALQYDRSLDGWEASSGASANIGITVTLHSINPASPSNYSDTPLN
jgi:hypothetical protein